MKMKDLPREVVVNGNFWRVRFVRRMPEGNENAIGLCVFDDKEILVMLCQSERERLATLIHELLHAIEHEYGVEIGHKLIGVIEYAVADMVINS